MGEYRLHGPPGTGKTWTLATVWVPRAVQRFGADKVVVCSLTKASARVIASRSTGLPKQNVGTLHSLCYRAVGTPDIAEGSLEEWNAAYPTLAQSLDRDRNLLTVSPHIDKPPTTRGDELAAEAQALRHRMVPRAEWPDTARYFQERWEAWMKETDRVDFTGLIELCLHGDSEAAPGSPRVLIVDEAQDCSVLELTLIRKWAKKAAYLVLAGDGDQAIYRWRGASPRAFLGGDIPEDNNYHLSRSYRVPGAVHAVASTWISQCSKRYAVEYTSTELEGRAFTNSAVSSRYPQFAVQEVQSSALRGETSMILAACAYSLAATLRSLREAAVPFYNPYRPSNLAWNPLRYGGERVRALLAAKPGHEGRLWTLGELQAWTELVDERLTVFAPSAKNRIKLRNGQRISRKSEDYELAPAELEDLLGKEAWMNLSAALEEERLVPWFESVALRSKRSVIDYAVAVYKKQGEQALIETPRIIVGTIHSTKGGEADHVYLFPDLSAAGMREWLRHGESRDSVRRLFYVGMTRAKKSLILCGASSSRSIQWPRIQHGTLHRN